MNRSHIILAVVLSAVLSPRLGAEDLSISPVVQDTPEWCWLAVGEMVFQAL